MEYSALQGPNSRKPRGSRRLGLVFADLVQQPDIANGLYDIHWLEKYLQKP